MVFRFVAIASIALLAACGPEGTTTTTPPVGPAPDTTEPDPDVMVGSDDGAPDVMPSICSTDDYVPVAGTGALAGRLLKPDGTPVREGFWIFACSKEECPRTETDANGCWIHSALPPSRARAIYAHDFHNFGANSPEFASVSVPATALDGQLIDLGETVIPALGGSAVEALAVNAQTISLLDGDVEIDVEADTIHYETGTTEADQQWQAGWVDADDLPNYDVKPWSGKEAGTLAIAIAPWKVSVTGGVAAMRVTSAGLTDAAVYDVWSVTPYLEDLTVDSEPQPVGTATVAGGQLVLDDGHSLSSMTLIMFVPQ